MRDEFDKKTKETVAKRASYRCSICRTNTIGPHSDPEKSLNTGRAAHICAAAEGGPRYDPSQTPEQRRSISNAIWLCSKHADEIDKDFQIYPADRLRDIRHKHEALVAGERKAPPPLIALENMHGSPFPSWSGGLEYKSDQHFRWLNLKIASQSSVELVDLSLRVQFPSFIEDWRLIDAPAGCAVDIGPAPSGASIYVTGHATVEMIGTSKATDVLLIKAERLRPHNTFTIGLKVRPVLRDPPQPPDEVEAFVPFYFDLNYQYVDEGAYLPMSYYYEIIVTEHRLYSVKEAKEKSDDVRLPTHIRIL